MKKLMNNTATAAAFAALLLVGACASNQGMGDQSDVSDGVVENRPEQVGQASTVVPAPAGQRVARWAAASAAYHSKDLLGVRSSVS